MMIVPNPRWMTPLRIHSETPHAQPVRKSARGRWILGLVPWFIVPAITPETSSIPGCPVRDLSTNQMVNMPNA
jgi:hypothetical protein